ncbi:MAG TPA: erythromycin esterase family protein [Bacteroidales bacterium]|nr:erythromycin esterase family protein [Bacteroidales bacterium]HPS18031.1 erythromycin esterase family protein [Bacteroidales bacterium]
MKTFLISVSILLISVTCSAQKSVLKVNPKWENSIQNVACEIKSFDSEDFSDLVFLKQLLKDKQYLFIGESSHEVAEFFKLRTRLIKFLHEQMGFKIIAFENDLNTTTFFNIQKDQALSIDSLMLYLGYFPCMEMCELVKYLRKNDIVTTGFDVQLSNTAIFSPAVRYYFKITDSILNDDSLFCVNAQNSIDAHTLAKKWNNAITGISGYDTLSSFAKCIYKSIKTRADWMERMPNISSPMRDSLMAANFLWLIKNMYPKEKVIILAHNEHIAKFNPAFKDKKKYYGSMGQYLQDSIWEKSYVMGIYAFQGQTGNYGPLCTISANKRNSLGAIFNCTGYDISFCDFLSQNKSVENNWMFKKKIKTVSYCFQRYKMVPADHYDGIIMVKNVHAITKLK